MNMNPLNMDIVKNRFFRKYVRHIDPLAQVILRRYMRRYAWKTLKKQDFTITEVSKSFQIDFNNRFGYFFPGFAPKLTYNNANDTWLTESGKVRLISRDCHLTYLLSELRGYLLLDNLVDGDVVVDVGATEGFTSAYFAKLVGPSGSVLAVEPESCYTDDFNFNMFVNGIHNVRLCRKMLVGNDSPRNADAIRLQELVTDYDIDPAKVKMIKVDIEGAELKLIDDMIKFVSAYENAYACIASYHFVDGEQTLHKIEDVCKKSPDVDAVTIYAHHPETIIFNKSNSELMRRLQDIGKDAAEVPEWWMPG
jgi:hypothetical protein